MWVLWVVESGGAGHRGDVRNLVIVSDRGDVFCRVGRHPASAAGCVGFGRRRDGVLVIERQASPPGDCSSCVLLSNGPRVISSCGDHIGQGNPEKMGGRCMATGPRSYAR